MVLGNGIFGLSMGLFIAVDKVAMFMMDEVLTPWKEFCR